MRWVGIRTLAASAKAMLVATLALAMVLPGQDTALSQTSGGPQVPLFTVIDLGDGAGLGISGAQQQVGENQVFDQARGGTFEHAMLWSGTAASAVDLNPNGFAMSQANGTSGVQQVGWGIVSPFGPPLRHALLWRGTAASAVDLGALLPPGFTFSEAQGTDSSNNIVGFASGPASPNGARALLWKGAAGGVVDLTPPGATGGAVAAGTAGTQQVGYGYVPDPARGFVTHALLWSGTASSAVDLHPTGFISSQATGIAGGQQVGTGFNLASRAYHALLWNGSASSAVDLNPSGFTVSIAAAVAGGQQVGYGVGPATGGFVSHALLWRGSAASAVDLNAFLPAGYTNSRASGIDANGNIIGWANGSGLAGHAFVWKAFQVPVLIIPGFLGSWTPDIRAAWDRGRVQNIAAITADALAMVGTHLIPKQMKQDRAYDDLISALQDKGLDVFVMPWDWANGGVQGAAADLDQFIRDHNFSKVDIIAHSAGGLVAQQYLQNRLGASADPHVRNLIIVGTPNKGSLLAHCLYFLDLTPCPIAAVADNLQARQLAETWQLILNALIAPLTGAQHITTIHDLMPTFPYLQRDRSPFAPFAIVNNMYLQSLNQRTLSDVGRLRAAGVAPFTVRGTTLPTPGLYVVQRNSNPRTELLKPYVVISAVTAIFQGDGSVLADSALIPGFNDVPVPNGTHFGLLDCLKEAYPRLRDTGSLTCGPQVRRPNTYVYIQTASPVSILLTDPSGRLAGTRFDTGTSVADIPTSTFFQSDHPGIFIDAASKGEYTLDVLGTGSGGAFELSIAFPNAFPTGTDTSVEHFSDTIRPGEGLRFTFDTFAFQSVTRLFAALRARLEINRASRRFDMTGDFTLGPGGTISPAAQAMTLQLGEGFLLTIPAGSFRSVEGGRRFIFRGMVNGVVVEADLTPTGGGTYSLKIEGERARALPRANPVEVRVAIGDNGGSVLVNADFGP